MPPDSPRLRRKQLHRQMENLGDFRRGTISVNYRKCGKNLFESENGTMLNPQNIYRAALAGILKGMGRSNVRYHAFRRFRESILLRSECRNILINFWHGHADSEMSSRYGKQLLEDVEFRQEWAKKGGLGFDLPTANPDLVELRGLHLTPQL